MQMDKNQYIAMNFLQQQQMLQENPLQNPLIVNMLNQPQFNSYINYDEVLGNDMIMLTQPQLANPMFMNNQGPDMMLATKLNNSYDWITNLLQQPQIQQTIPQDEFSLQKLNDYDILQLQNLIYQDKSNYQFNEQIKNMISQQQQQQQHQQMQMQQQQQPVQQQQFKQMKNQNIDIETQNYINQEELQKQKEKIKIERNQKIERYKNKRRNWIRRISYDCRKRVADSRLRIKGRFISKKDSEKIKQLVGGKQEEAFNDKKNLNIDYISTKLNFTKGKFNQGVVSNKSNITKNEILNRIDQILTKSSSLLEKHTTEKIIQRIKDHKPIFFVMLEQIKSELDDNTDLQLSGCKEQPPQYEFQNQQDITNDNIINNNSNTQDGVSSK